MANDIMFEDIKEDKQNILNLNRSRQRAIYYRPLTSSPFKDDIVWAPTLLLPADPQSIAYYFAKGFRAKPPDSGKKDGEKDVPGTISCPLCGFRTDSVFGLEVHLRTHRKNKRKEETT